MDAEFWLTIAGAALSGILSAGGAWVAVRIELAVLRQRVDGHEKEIGLLREWYHSIRGML